MISIVKLADSSILTTMSMKPACEIPECINKADYVLEYECGSEPNDTAFICRDHANVNSKHWNMRVKSVMEL